MSSAASPYGGTAVPPGNCPTHGYHGRVACPRCSTSAIPPAPLGQAPSAATTEPAAVHAARSHGDKHSRELVAAWDEVTEKLNQGRGLLSAVTMARRFHELYEELAPACGYETREETRVPWPEVPAENRRLMISVCMLILAEMREEGALRDGEPF